ncbi:MAG: cold shock domain-containing protein [Hyphomicrobiaceae bacterium]|nr:cold shock domain-containing protein [Hyphomicrobiaceae bacterium]
MEDAAANEAIRALDGTDFGGRNLRVNPAQPREQGGRGGGGGGYRGGGGGGYRGGGGGGGYRGGGDGEGGGFRGGDRGPQGEGGFRPRPPRGPRQSGTVKFFNGERGFGFIVPDDNSGDIFVHISAVERGGLPPLEEGQRLSFETEPDRKGKGLKAVFLRPVEDEEAPADEGASDDQDSDFDDGFDGGFDDN